jgi:REP element-mobilizing transposase RayT
MGQYDYSSPGAYFITIAAYKHKCLFGDVVDFAMDLNRVGTIVRNCWMEIPKHFPYVEVEPSVIMPNHIHGVITINDDKSRGTIYCIRQGHK